MFSDPVSSYLPQEIFVLSTAPSMLDQPRHVGHFYHYGIENLNTSHPTINISLTSHIPPSKHNPHPPSLLPPIITPHPTPIKRPIIPQRKLAPIVAEPVMAPEPLPSQFVVARALARVSELEREFVGVPGHDALGFDVEGAFFFFF